MSPRPRQIAHTERAYVADVVDHGVLLHDLAVDGVRLALEALDAAVDLVQRRVLPRAVILLARIERLLRRHLAVVGHSSGRAELLVTKRWAEWLASPGESELTTDEAHTESETAGKEGCDWDIW